MKSSTLESHTPRAPLEVDRGFGLAMAALRVFFGIVFLANGLSKFFPAIAHTPVGFLIDNAGARGIITYYAHHNPVGLYRGLVDQVILPNWGSFGALVGVTESAVGLLLVLGLFTRIAALVGGLLLLHLQFASLFSNQWVFEYSVEWVPVLALVALRAGRWYGLDSRLPADRPRWLR